ncbi:unnamed protein product [Prorocentrum cordatum]|uniref:CHRD domain-containing protein n=1 Tax=Prorocentrum cordatum TaxID=2364126 RepID=A0ABN9XZQ1_9DINO|nr:unnamed protein product [Polarella glacialis]
MERIRTAVVAVLLWLVPCQGLSIHNCGGQSDGKPVAHPVAKPENMRKANAGSALSAMMGPYPGSSSGVSGVVSVTMSGGLLKVAYTLTGLDASLTSGGLHIHSGSGTDVCSDSSLPGGHYFATGFVDPWSTTWSKTAGSTTATGSFSVGASGYDTLAENEFHAVVAHGAGGARVGCGFLQYYGGLTSAIGEYPGTSSGVSGLFKVSVYTGLLEVSYTLEGLAASSTSGGLHIHSGSGTNVCSDASLPGGHYYAAGVTDPWFTTWSKSSGSTSASGTFIVGVSGHDTLAENYLHAVVVHASSGSRIGCGYLGTYTTLSSELAAAMGPYPGTSSSVGGVVSVTVLDSGLLRLAYYVDGLSASETSGGLHIHSGSGESVCSDASLPGGHYFKSGYGDPWFTTWSKPSGSTSASGTFVVGASGYDTLAENYLHAVVVHASSGSRVGCGYLGTYTTLSSELAAAMGPYPGSSSSVGGVVSVSVMDSGLLRLAYYVDGLSLAGSTFAKGSFTVGASGYDTLAQNVNHAVVLHSASGARIGCGSAGAGNSLTAAMGSYPGTSSGVSGSVMVSVSMGLLHVTYTLTGLSSSDTSGGLHIHSGHGESVCSSSALPGGHYFATGFTDPWYTTWKKTAGTTSASGSFSVLASGYDTLADNYLHAVVAHAGSGARIGCGVLGGSTASPFATGDPHLQNIHGERFDLLKPGHHLLIQIPRKSFENTLLRVDAEAQRMGGQCTDMYFQELNITGAWAEAQQTGGFHYHAQDVHSSKPRWEHFENVQLKVARGRTQQGIKYLNLYVKDLTRTGYAVGGLLGDDDFTDAATPEAGCVRQMAL